MTCTCYHRDKTVTAVLFEARPLLCNTSEIHTSSFIYIYVMESAKRVSKRGCPG